MAGGVTALVSFPSPHHFRKSSGVTAWLFCWAETVSAQVTLEMRLFWTQVSGPSIVRGAALGIMLSGFFCFVFVYDYQGKFWKRKFTWGKNDHLLRDFLEA